MYLCRVAFYNLAPAAKISFSSRLLRNAYRTGIRQMSSGGHSGSSGENVFYALMIGGVFAGAGLYAYKVLQEDKVRYNDRIAELMERPKSIQSESEEMPQDLQPKSTEKAEDSSEVPSAEVVEVSEEASVTESVEQPEIPASVEPSEEKSTVEEEMITVLPASTSAKDDSQTPEVPEAGGEATEVIAVKVQSPVVDDAEQTENPPAVVEPAVSSEEEEVTSVAQEQ